MSNLTRVYSAITEEAIALKKLAIDGELTLLDLQKKITSFIPFVQQCKKNDSIKLDSVENKQMQLVLNRLLNMKYNKTTHYVMEMIKVYDVPFVKFYDSNLQKNKNSTMDFFPPRMVINLSNIELNKNSGVCINTGYIIRMNNVCAGRKIEQNTIVKTSVQRQPNVIIIPIVQKTNGIIYDVCARDADDTGLLTINFKTTSSELPKKLEITFNAYSVDTGNMNKIQLIKPASTAAVLFKIKDSQFGRNVKNPKVKFISDKFTIDSNDGSLLLDTFDNKQKTIEIYPEQKIKISNVKTLFVPRRREWFNENLATFVGLYDPTNPQNNIKPIIIDGSKYDNNTHCMVFINEKINLFSYTSNDFSKCKLLNGSFANINEFDTIRSRIKKLYKLLDCMSVAAKSKEAKIGDFNKYMHLIDINKIGAIEISSPTMIDLLYKKFYNEETGALHYDDTNIKSNSASILRDFNYLYTYFNSTTNAVTTKDESTEVNEMGLTKEENAADATEKENAVSNNEDATNAAATTNSCDGDINNNDEPLNKMRKIDN